MKSTTRHSPPRSNSRSAFPCALPATALPANGTSRKIFVAARASSMSGRRSTRSTIPIARAAFASVNDEVNRQEGICRTALAHGSLKARDQRRQHRPRPLQMSDAPPFLLGLDLIEEAFGAAFDRHQRSIVRPPQHRRKASLGVMPFHRKRKILQYATCRVAIRPRTGFATCDVAKVRGPPGIDLMEVPKVAQVGRRESPSKPLGEAPGEVVDQAPPVLRPIITPLQGLNDLSDEAAPGAPGGKIPVRSANTLFPLAFQPDRLFASRTANPA